MAKNKSGFVTGLCLRPVDNPILASHWDRCNNMVISWLLHSVEKDIAQSILYHRSASAIWSDLAAHFARSNRTRLFHIQRSLYTLSQDTSSISSHYTKSKTIWDEYTMLLEDRVCVCGSGALIHDILQDQQVVRFLASLNDSYNSACAQILMIQPPPSLNEVYKLLLQEEEQRELSNKQISSGSSLTDTSALVSQRFVDSKNMNRGNDFSRGHGGTIKNSRGSIFCDHCKIGGQTTDNCWKLHGHTKFCDHCSLGGHTADKCWKKHGYPAGKGPRTAASASSKDLPASTTPSGFTNEQYNQLLALLKNNNAASSDSTAFLAGKNFCFLS